MEHLAEHLTETREHLCEICGIDISDKRSDATTCSPQCRKQVFLKRSIEPAKRSKGTAITLSVPVLEIIFKFKTKDKRSPSGFHQQNGEDIIRQGKYWYDIPLGAVPLLQAGWPEMPAYMNGRQYFLWWKNEFIEEAGKPVIHNPLPSTEGARVELAGEQSRRWGA